MGLDMYLDKEIYVGGEYEHRNVRGVVDISIGDENINIPLNKLSTIRMRMGYWRKANHIHKWFVDNVQDGEDNCQDAYVEMASLEDLKHACEQVLADHSLAHEILPVQSGFFFGSTEYDEYYFQDIEDTVKIINECIECGGGDFYYRSSW